LHFMSRGAAEPSWKNPELQRTALQHDCCPPSLSGIIRRDRGRPTNRRGMVENQRVARGEEWFVAGSGLDSL